MSATAILCFERLTPPIPEIAAEYWIIVHRDLRRAACVRAVIDWVKALFAERRDIYRGRHVDQHWGNPTHSLRTAVATAQRR